MKAPIHPLGSFFQKHLVVLDGIVRDDLTVKDVDQIISKNNVQHITVLKGSSAITKYGDKGLNGVLEIVTKKDTANKIPEKKLEEPKSMKYWDTLRNKPLVIVDGKKYPQYDFNNLDPNIIESINVIKDQSAILKYGDDGRNGAIEIFTKKDTANKLQKIKPDNKIFDKVETEPSFPGGSSAWVRYLERNTDPSVPVRKKAPEGSYTVVIQFIVDKEGKISDVTALTNHGFGMEEEAIRSISKGPVWIPAMQNGHNVTVYKKQPITFIVGNDQKSFPSHVKATGNELKEVVLVGYMNNKILTKVEAEPSFPGGQNAFDMYIAANQKKYKTPVTNPGLSGKLRIMYTSFVVKFMVDIDGSVSDITLPGYDKVGFGNDAIDLIKNGPKWIPAMQNGKPVKAYKNQTVRFAITEEDGSKPDKVFTQTETPPSFPGGEAKWKQYLEYNAKGNIPMDSGAPAGTYKVIVQFIVKTDGSVTDVKALTNYGYGMEKESMRLISKGPKWIPATQNGKPVDAYKKQPITFSITEDDDPKKNTPPITMADLQKASVYQLLQLKEGTEIKSFSFSVDMPNDNIALLANQGNQFNGATINLIKSITPGRTILIDNIITTENGKEKKEIAKAYMVTN